MPPLAPSWRLKIIPRADGPGPAIKQLVDGAAAGSDVVVHECFRGRGTVHFEPNPHCDLTCLAPQEHLDAYYLEMSYTEGLEGLSTTTWRGSEALRLMGAP